MLTDDERLIYEARIEKALGRVITNRKFIAALGTPPDTANLSSHFWGMMTDELVIQLEPVILEMARASAAALGDQTGTVGLVNWDLVNERAVIWADQYTYDLVTGINNTTETLLSNTISRFYRDSQMTLADVVATIQPHLPDLLNQLGRVITNETRAKMIAVTEATRAAAEGEQALIDTIRTSLPNAGILDIWLTSNDEHVCPNICGPLNGVHGDGDGNFTNPETGETFRLPGHPWCRCGRGVIITDLPALETI